MVLWGLGMTTSGLSIVTSFALFQRGKGVSSPEPPTTPYIYLIDITFLGDKLYAITETEDLIPLDLALDGDGRPMVTMGTRVIKKSLYYDFYELWTTFYEEGRR